MTNRMNTYQPWRKSFSKVSSRYHDSFWDTTTSGEWDGTSSWCSLLFGTVYLFHLMSHLSQTLLLCTSSLNHSLISALVLISFLLSGPPSSTPRMVLKSLIRIRSHGITSFLVDSLSTYRHQSRLRMSITYLSRCKEISQIIWSSSFWASWSWFDFWGWGESLGTSSSSKVCRLVFACFSSCSSCCCLSIGLLVAGSFWCENVILGYHQKI